MNRTEQKDILKDILVRINELKDDLQGRVQDVITAFAKISELGDYFEDTCSEPESWDEEQLKNDFIISILVNSEINEIHSELYDFKSELESYMEEISESKQEKLEERYADLESVLEMFEYDDSEENIENVIDRVVEGEALIKAML